MKARHQLLVEGQDEKFLFEYLLGKNGSVEVRCLGGKDSLSRQLRQVAKRNPEEIASVIVVLDAEENATRAFRIICEALGAVGFAQPAATNTWAGNDPPVLIALLPPDATSGCFEDLFLKAWEATASAEMDCLRRLRICWPPANITEAKWSKIFANVILRAKQGNDDFGVGNALTKEHFNKLLTCEPLTQLKALADRIVQGPHA